MTQTFTGADDLAARSIILTRIVNAPRELVYKVWTEAEHVALWWGPDGFTNTIHEMEVRPGGVWRFIMHGPDGVDYPNRIQFTQVVPPERLEYTHGADDNDPDLFQVVTTFEAVGSQTRVTLNSVFRTAADRDRVVEEHGAIEGGSSTYAGLQNTWKKWLASGLCRLGRLGQAESGSGIMDIEPYLFFNGCCEEAVEFYKKALGANGVMMMRYKDSPEKPPPGMIPDGWDDKIMHCNFRIGDATVMASDGSSASPIPFSGFALCVNAKDIPEAERFFGGLSDGGQVQMPLGKTFFAEHFGMVADKFGVSWMIIVGPVPN